MKTTRITAGSGGNPGCVVAGLKRIEPMRLCKVCGKPITKKQRHERCR